jgi:hypothetical protein
MCRQVTPPHNNSLQARRPWRAAAGAQTLEGQGDIIVDFGLLGLLASVLAVVVSTVALIRSRRTEAAQEELHAITKDLRRVQLEILGAAVSESSQARITGHLRVLGNESYFEFSNEGQAAAYEVNLDIQPTGKGTNPVMPSDLAEKIPWPKLDSGQSFRIQSWREMNSARTFRVIVRWKDSSGAQHEEQLFLAV